MPSSVARHIPPPRRRLGGVLALMAATMLSPAVLAQAPQPVAPIAISALNEVTFAADQLLYDTVDGLVEASGDVVFRYGRYELRADRVIYDEASGRVVADGDVRLDAPDGSRLVSRRMVLDDGLSAGLIAEVRLIFADQSRLAASRAERSDDGRTTRLFNSVYSACPLCDDTPNQRPIWRITAAKVVHRADKKRVYYRNATLDIFGVPVIFTPYFSHPDPSVDRARGFLAPEIRQRQELGLVLEAPFHIPFSASSDLTLIPIITTRENPALAIEQRRHFGFARYEFEGSVTFTGSDAADDLGLLPGEEGLRGHVFADGIIQHSRRWRSRIQGQFVTDDTYLRIYDFSNADSLVSRYDLEGFLGRSFVGVTSVAFQGLRLEDVTGLVPFALPLVEAEYVASPDRLGGTFSAGVNFLNLTRPDGLDTRRATIQGGYHIPWISPLGHKVTLDLFGRFDYYNIDDSAAPDDPLFTGIDGEETRALTRGSLEVSWPFIRPGRITQIIEPVAIFTASPDGGNPEALSNEDLRAFELTDSNLLNPDRLGGFDLWEPGRRTSYGLRYSLASNRVDAEFFFGQSFRFDALPDLFIEGTGLSDNFSDYVGRVDVRVGDYLDAVYRIRLDPGSFDPEVHDASATIGPPRFRTEVRYLNLDRGLPIFGRTDREELQVRANIGLTRTLTLFGSTIQDLTDGIATIDYSTGLRYKNDCLDLSLSVRESFTTDRDVEAGISVRFQISLTNIG